MSTFKDPELERVFIDLGYVILPRLIVQQDLVYLQNTLQKFEGAVKEPFHTSHFSSDIDYKLQTQSAIIDTVFPKISPYLEKYKPIFGNFMIKKGGGHNFLQMHADWTYIDESLGRSVSVWIPFVDTNESNGCLGVIEYSQKFMNSIRGPGIQQNTFERDKLWIRKYGKLLPMRAGDAIVYDHGLLHFSTQNNTEKVRPALNLSLIPENIDCIHYCKPEGADVIEKYNVSDPSFFMHYENWQRPQMSAPTETIPLDIIKLIDNQMEAYGENYQNKLDRVKSYIKGLRYSIMKKPTE